MSSFIRIYIIFKIQLFFVSSISCVKDLHCFQANSAIFVTSISSVKDLHCFQIQLFCHMAFKDSSLCKWIAKILQCIDSYIYIPKKYNVI